MLKLYLNENLSWRIAKALREYGYDVVSSEECQMNQTDDRTQFLFAVEQERAIITNNFRDFVELHEECIKEGKTHYGLVFTTKCETPLMIRRLRTLLEKISREDLINRPLAKVSKLLGVQTLVCPFSSHRERLAN